MLATGGLLLSIALLTLAALTPVFHSSDPPRWTTRGWIGEFVTVSIVCALALGLSFLGAGAIDTFQTGPDWLDIGLLALVVLASIGIWRRLRATRSEAAEPPASIDVPPSGSVHSGDTAKSPALAASEPPPPQGHVADVGGVPSLRD
jgi:hypothetical protein